MKKAVFIAIMMIFTLGATTTFAAKNDLKSTAPVATENKLSTEELSQMKNRVEEIKSGKYISQTMTPFYSIIQKKEVRK